MKDRPQFVQISADGSGMVDPFANGRLERETAWIGPNSAYS
jgi:hypothetical protein